MDQKIVSAFLGVLVVFMGLYIVGSAFSDGGCVNETKVVYPDSDLSVFYLYPLRCVDCDLTEGGACDYCNSYYDLRLMDLVSDEVGVPVEFVVSDVVSRPNVFVVYDDKAVLGDARTRYNIAGTVCAISGLEKPCSVYAKALQDMQSCLSDYGVADDAIVYHRSSENCPVCSKTDRVVEDLRGEGYSVYTLDHADGDDMDVIRNCMAAFDHVDYTPQLLCPTTGKDLTGEFDLSQGIDFAETC